MAEFILLSLLFIKHHILDFEYQPPFQWQNKGTYGHIGGIIHSGQHILGTILVLLVAVFLLGFNLSLYSALAILIFEFVMHYHMDWFKMWYGKKKEMNPYQPIFYKWLGRDQLVHNMTYVIIFAYCCYLQGK